MSVIGFHLSTAPPGDCESVGCEKPTGIRLIEDFITDEEEAVIVNIVQNRLLHPGADTEQGELRQRAVVHFGREFDYSTNSGNDEKCFPIPDEVKRLCSQICDLTGDCIDQITANIYTAGDGIPPHVDNPYAFGANIISLSLLSPVQFHFKRGDNTYDQDLPRKSLLIMSAESRYSWQHSIVARKFDNINGEIRSRQDRISLTFRRCVTPLTAGSIIERCLVKNVYDQIADDFSSSRYKMWPMVETFVNAIPADCLLGDIGCGNGKNLMGHRESGIGLDVSINLATICRGKT